MDMLRLVLMVIFGVTVVVSISCRIYAESHPEVKKKWYGEDKEEEC